MPSTPTEAKTFPVDGSTFVLETIERTAYRWAKYKPDGARQMGKPGRWQKQVWHGDYFKWENCEEPYGELSPPIEDGPISAAFNERPLLLSLVEDMAKALKPLSKVAEEFDRAETDRKNADPVWGYNNATVTYGDFRDALSALSRYTEFLRALSAQEGSK